MAVNEIPNEIWQRIFGFVALDTDKSHCHNFWAAGRNVCRSWRANIAQAYLRSIVRDPRRCYIYCECDVWSGLTLIFDRLDENDKSRCIFKETKTLEYLSDDWGDRTSNEDLEQEKYETWEKNFYFYLGEDACTQMQGGCFDQPAHVIALRGYANDTALPRLQFDIVKREISFGWEDMLDSFCFEQAELCKRRCTLAEAFAEEQKAAGLTALNNEFFDTAFRSIRKIEDTTQRDVRRERIIAFYNNNRYWKKHGMEFALRHIDEKETYLQRIKVGNSKAADADYYDDDEEEEEEKDHEDVEDGDDSGDSEATGDEADEQNTAA